MSKKKWRKIKRHWKKRFRRLRHLIAYVTVVSVHRFFLLFPLNRSMRIGESLGALAFHLVRRERLKALRNLNIAYGDSKTAEEKRAIVKALFRHIGRTVGENAHLYSLSRNKEILQRRVNIIGAEHLLRAYERGKGVIGLTAHLGNWELLAVYLAAILKVKFAVVARNLNNPRLDRLLNSVRAKLGIRVIHKGRSGISLLRTLRHNEGLGMLADQDSRGEGLFVPFFGNLAHTQIGVAKLALATGTPIVPMFIVRNDDGCTHTIFIEPPLSFDLTNNPEADIKTITQTFTHRIESYVRNYPTQWMWIHNRWKQKPPVLRESAP
jgi:KDO2-lipid IV(A) lauroyltransferase